MSMSVLLYTNKRDMRILLSLLYAEKANEADTENEIKMLIDIIDDYTEEKCIEFEDNKRTAMRLLQQSTIKSKTKLSYISNSNSNVLHQKNSKKKVNESNNNNIMSLNFINRVTKVTELLLYERISMAANDIYFLTADTKLYNSKTFNNYYNVDINIENNVIFDILKESEFAYLYYQSLQISKNIEEFMTKQKGTYLLQEVVHLENLINEKNGLCIYGSIGFEFFNSTVASLTELFEKDSTKVCKAIGNGMALNPINELISYIMSEMTSIYTDFVRFDISTRDIMKFLRRETLINANEIIKDPLKKIHNSLISGH